MLLNENPAGTKTNLQISELAAIYDSAPVGLCVLDANLRFVRINERLAEINGISVQDHLGRALREVLPELADVAEPLLRRVLETGEAMYNVEISGETPAHPGLKRTWLENFVPLFDENKQVRGINITAEEITARKRGEDALRHHQMQLKMALEGARLGLWWNNLQTGETYWDARTREIFGVEPDSPATLERGWALIHPDDRQHAQTAFEMATAAGASGAYEEEKRIVRPDGTVRWVATKGQVQFIEEGDTREPLFLTGVISDVTASRKAQILLEEQKHALEQELVRRQELETALRESEARFRELADAMPQLVWMARPDGVVDYYNRRREEFAGIRQVGDKWEWNTVLHADDVARTVAAWQQAVSSGERYQVEHRVMLADGSWRWFLSRGVPARDQEGNIIRWYGTATDIHEQRMANQQLEQLNETLEQRVETRTSQVRHLAAELTRAEQRERRRIAQVLHDDLQQMLVALKVKLYLHASGVGESTLAELEQEVDDMLEVTRTLTGTLNAPGAISARLVESLSWVTTLMAERYGLRVRLDVDDDYQIADQDLREILVSMVRELLFNIVKHADVDTACLRLRQDQEHLLIHVEDGGVGFDVSTLQSGKPHRGFGLYSVAERLRLFGGWLEIDSQPGQGTRITLTIPKTDRMDHEG